jgi:ABC-type uncharacterized transport system substrate-binding protein
MIPTMQIVCRLVAAAAALAALAAPARAHPHVWVTVSSQVIYDTKGAATGVRHAWKFDDMYSAFALEGLPQKTKGVFTREELAGLAEVNITSLKESDFFTFARSGGKEMSFGDARDYWLDYRDQTLTLNFTLPFKTPVQARDLAVEVYDPSYFVAFEFAEKDAVALVGAPAQCKAAVERPKESGLIPGSPTSEAALMSGNPGATFASRIAVKCP